MSDAPPPSLLITPDTRRRLQQRYEEAVRLMTARPCDFARVHDLLAECMRTDPGNILYIDELFANLRRWNPKATRSWFAGWFGAKREAPGNSPESPDEWLRAAPELLRQGYDDAALLGQLAAAACACQFDEAELVYWWDAVSVAPEDVNAVRGLARCLTRCGRFEEAWENWQKIARIAPNDESARALIDLGPESIHTRSEVVVGPSNFDPADPAQTIEAATRLQDASYFPEAESLLRQLQAAAGADLRVFQALEALQLARSRHRMEIAKLRAASDAHPNAQSLVAKLEQEHNRLEIDILHLRSERHPDDLSLRLELARRLKRAGNYSGAIQRLEEARAEPALAAAVLLELGECWQHLRQFGKALEFYRQVVEREIHSDETPTDGSRRPLVGALYRIGVLAAAIDQPDEAKAALSRLLAIDPGYKDARQRLDKLP